MRRFLRYICFVAMVAYTVWQCYGSEASSSTQCKSILIELHDGGLMQAGLLDVLEYDPTIGTLTLGSGNKLTVMSLTNITGWRYVTVDDFTTDVSATSSDSQSTAIGLEYHADGLHVKASGAVSLYRVNGVCVYTCDREDGEHVIPTNLLSPDVYILVSGDNHIKFIQH